MRMRLQRFWKPTALAVPAVLCLMAGCQSHQVQAGQQTPEGQSQQALTARPIQEQQRQSPLIAVGPQKGDAAKAAGRVSVAPPQAQSSITIGCDSPVELLITDPQGRKLGFDPGARKQYDEIPASADDKWEEGAGETLLIANPIGGQYQLSTAGAESATYSCDFFGAELKGGGSKAQIKGIPTKPGEIHKFFLSFDGSGGAQLKVAGGFRPTAGSGSNGPILLSYGSPTTTTVVLPAGQREAPFLVFYGEQVDAASFSATLNGALLPRLFHPQAGAWEMVQVPVTEHHNRLKLAVHSQTGTAVDDTFEITVP